MDWTVVLSVIVGIFLFNVVFRGLQFVLSLLVGLTVRRQITSPEHSEDVEGLRGNFLGS